MVSTSLKKKKERKKEKKKKKKEGIKESLNRSAIYFSNGWARASAETRRRANREAKIAVKGVFDSVADEMGKRDLLVESIRGSALAFISIAWHQPHPARAAFCRV